MSMPERDVRWSIFVAGLADYDGAGRDANLVGLDQGMDEIEDDRAELAAITLTWLFSTSARVIRDPATKALACLLATRLGLAVKFIDHFRPVDDLYVKERLFGAIYGAVMQGAVASGLSIVAQAVYDEVFAKGAPPLNALLREHAAGVIQYAHWRNELPATVDMLKVQPPYQSPWPIEFVPESLIETYVEYNSSGPFRDDIVRSTTSMLGDFGHYVIDRVVRKFAAVPIGQPLLGSGEIFSVWLDAFMKSATPEQKDAWSAVFDAAQAATGSGLKETPEKLKLAKAEDAFRATLSDEGWVDYCVEVRDYLAHRHFITGREDRSAASFNSAWGSRGYARGPTNLAGRAGGSATSIATRDAGLIAMTIESARRQEYQWLALNELAARMGDNLAFKGNSFAPDDEPPRSYRGARDLDLRDIDPSLLVRQTHYDGWRRWPRSWWLPAEVNLRSMSPQERLAWKDGDADIMNDASLIEVTAPTDGRRWLALHSLDFGAKARLSKAGPFSSAIRGSVGLYVVPNAIWRSLNSFFGPTVD